LDPISKEIDGLGARVSHLVHLQGLSPSTKRLVELTREEGTARYRANDNVQHASLLSLCVFFLQREYINIAKIPIGSSLYTDKMSENIKDTQNQKTKKREKKRLHHSFQFFATAAQKAQKKFSKSDVFKKKIVHKLHRRLIKDLRFSSWR
jgi:hypothetical protein